ncbi:hypothetical protein HEK616_34650 [Streptomyces nigrescens]|uniref:Uncharacterized protein n=1 Tax=Streptomyces nigrescens TaxID=1920 RepID=A0ABM7ZUC3_STRNI|nr:hypothetical protein [Streptomyces nigrescens]BDM69978.1 hypothetical protein HEK616_34650 [Streptomyces nigrescens]
MQDREEHNGEEQGGRGRSAAAGGDGVAQRAPYFTGRQHDDGPPSWGGTDRSRYLDQRSNRYRWNRLVEVQSQRHRMTLVLLSFHD